VSAGRVSADVQFLTCVSVNGEFHVARSTPEVSPAVRRCDCGSPMHTYILQVLITLCRRQYVAYDCEMAVNSEVTNAEQSSQGLREPAAHDFRGHSSALIARYVGTLLLATSCAVSCSIVQAIPVSLLGLHCHCSGCWSLTRCNVTDFCKQSLTPWVSKDVAMDEMHQAAIIGNIGDSFNTGVHHAREYTWIVLFSSRLRLTYVDT
jgi:hypothetical protein